MRRLAVIRVDASPIMGGGHAMRCLALADGLADVGWHCIFAVRASTIETVPVFACSPHKVISLEKDEADEEAELKRRIPEGCALLVVDHYGRDIRFESACRGWASTIMAVDDLANRRHDVDILLDQTLNRLDADYRPLVPPSCRLLLGPQWAMLRPEFAAARSSALARRDGLLRRLLVSLGATDPRDVTSMVLRAVEQSGLDLAVDIALGSASPNIVALRQIVSASRGRVRLHENVRAMAELMTEADLAVGASGVSSWERCCLGLPTLAMVIADNQRLAIQALTLRGAVVALGDWTEYSESGVVEALRSLAVDPKRLRGLAQAAAGACDGGGVERVTELLMESL